MNRRHHSRRHACERCVELKVKCAPIVDSRTCERCLRLGRPCIFPDDVPGRRPRRSRIDGLEEKVNNLASQVGKNVWDVVNAQCLQNTSSSTTMVPESSPAIQITQERSTTQPENTDGFISRASLTVQEADELLRKFREHKMHHFPFVIIPEGMDASALRRESPFLLLCILTACLEHIPVLQDKLEREIREIIGTRLISKMERNMDLLQGLLVHTAWYHYHWTTYHTQAYMLLQIAIMLVVDLGLDKDENFRMQAIPQDGKDSDQVHGQGIHQTPAGQRALVGCYYLCSKLSIFRRQLIMRHTHWIDQCGRNLALEAEFPTDSNLKAYLEVQSLVRKTQVMLEAGLDNHSESSCQGAWERVFELMEKQRIEERLQGSNDNWALRLELSATKLLVLGHSLRRQKDVFYLHEMGQIQAITSSAHRMMTTFLNIPSTVAIHLPTSCYIILWYGLLALSKLSLLFPSHTAVQLGIDNQKIRNVGIAIMQKIGSFSKSGDVWENSKNVIGSMLSWLEKSKPETQRMAPVQAGPVVWNRNSTIDTRHRLSSAHTGLTSSPGAREDAYIHQDTWPSTSHLDPADYIEAQAAVDWDASLWQEMLDNFSWFSPAIGSATDFGEANILNTEML